MADSFVAAGTMRCGSEEVSGNGATILRAMMGQLEFAMGQLETANAQGPGAVSEINLGVIGDFEFTAGLGANADSQLLARINNVDGIFSEQLGVQINVETLESFPSANDPFSNTTDASTLLDELTDYRASTPAHRDQGLTHLFTGRELDTSTVGLAYSGELCIGVEEHHERCSRNANSHVA